MNKNIEIISLIFKSVEYLQLIYEQLTSVHCHVPDWRVGLRIVANDATPDVLARLHELNIPYTVYNDSKPNDYYLNRVYRCWNHAGFTSTYDNICFVNSDMIFSSNWLTNLLHHHDGTHIPTSRLVESGKIRSGTYGISYNCGRHPKQINYDQWGTCVATHIKHEVHERGLYMPCVFETSRFIESGGYPEGNIFRDGIGTQTRKAFLQSGDAWFFEKLTSEYGMKHITVFDSLVYHIQEGEKDES